MRAVRPCSEPAGEHGWSCAGAHERLAAHLEVFVESGRGLWVGGAAFVSCLPWPETAAQPEGVGGIDTARDFDPQLLVGYPERRWTSPAGSYGAPEGPVPLVYS